MYHRQNINNEKPYQTVDLSSLKKKNNDPIASYQNNKITLYNLTQTSILTIIGFFQFSSNPNINEDIFQKVNFDQSPKAFQSYTHEKTMKSLLKIIINSSISASNLIDLIDQFPIMNFVIESYCRFFCITYIRNNKQLSLFGNQQLVLQDYNMQVRGNLLSVMADAFETQIILNVKQIQQIYGKQKNQKKIYINIGEDFMQGQLLQKKGTSINSVIKSYPNSTAKTLKQVTSKQTETSENGKTTVGQNSSVLKDSMVTDGGKCQRCRLLKGRCICSKKVINSGYNTPKSGSKHQNHEQSSLNINFSVINKGKCTCNKIFCMCRK